MKNRPKTKPHSNWETDELTEYGIVKELCLRHVTEERFVDELLNHGYGRRDPATLTYTDLGSLLHSCKQLGNKHFRKDSQPC